MANPGAPLHAQSKLFRSSEVRRDDGKLSWDDGDEVAVDSGHVLADVPLDYVQPQRRAVAPPLAPQATLLSVRLPVGRVVGEVSLSVQHRSWDSGEPPESADDGEPVPRERPEPPPPKPKPNPNPTPKQPEPKPHKLEPQWVLRGPPPLPEKVDLHAPRFAWVPGAFEFHAPPRASHAAAAAPGVYGAGVDADAIARSLVRLPWPATSSSSMVPPSYDNARVCLGRR